MYNEYLKMIQSMKQEGAKPDIYNLLIYIDYIAGDKYNLYYNIKYLYKHKDKFGNIKTFLNEDNIKFDSDNLEADLSEYLEDSFIEIKEYSLNNNIIILSEDNEEFNLINYENIEDYFKNKIKSKYKLNYIIHYLESDLDLEEGFNNFILYD